MKRVNTNTEQLLYRDEVNKFNEVFWPSTGAYIRSDVDGTKEDPFMRDFPSLIDIGIMGHCTHGASGLCVKSGVQCYQNGLKIRKENMNYYDFRRIITEASGKTFQVALGGRGDPNKHEHFEELLSTCRDFNIVPNYTTSGLDLTVDEVRASKACGAVAVSWYRSDYTLTASDKFLKAGIKTNIHYVLGKNSIDEAIERLKDNSFPEGVNAVIFLLHKPVGLGMNSNVLTLDHLRLREFFTLIDTGKFPFKIGFDSCTIPAIVNFTKHIDPCSIDACEAGRFSMYVTADMKALPCSFDQKEEWAYDISNATIADAWNSGAFDRFRNNFKVACGACAKKALCYGGCPITPSITLCGLKS